MRDRPLVTQVPSGSRIMPGPLLTPAEERILELLPTHLTLAQMAAQLYISRNTAKSQAAAIYRKLLVAGRDEAVHRARALGLLPSRPDGRSAAPAPGDGQAPAPAFRTGTAHEAEWPPGALASAARAGPTGRVPRQAEPWASSPAREEPITGLDAVTVLAHGSAARSEAGEIRARARRARQKSHLLRRAAHGLRLPIQGGFTSPPHGNGG